MLSPWNDMQLKEKLRFAIRVGRWLHQKGWLASADGNISFRHVGESGQDEIWMTPSGVHKGFLNIDQMTLLNLNGDVLKGSPSSERAMHLAVYHNSPKAQAVVHAHPPHAIAWSVARPELKELPAGCLSEVILAVGSIPFVPYARPGTAQMGEVLHGYLPQSRVLILSRHGALSWGEDLQEAYNGMERLEHSAEILKLASELGPLTELPQHEIEYLFRLRSQLGERTL